MEQFSQSARIRYIFEPIKGLSQARNTGWQAANGKYVAYLDDDAIACPRWLEKIMEAFETVKPAPASVGGRVVPLWESERPVWLEDRLLGAYAIVDWGDQARFLKPSNPEHHVGCNVAYTRQVLQECGGFNVNLGRKGRNLLSNDENLIRKYMDSHGLGIYYDPEILVEHVVPKERLTRRFMLRRHFWQGISDVVEWYEESSSPPGRLWLLMSGIEGLIWVGLYLTFFLLRFFLRRPWVVVHDLATIESARDCFFRGFDNLWRMVGQSHGYLQIGMGRLATGAGKGVALEQGADAPSLPPPKRWAWRTVRPYLLAYLKTNHPLMISIVRFAKRVMLKLKNILSGSNGMMCNTIMKLTLMTPILAVLATARSPRRINPKIRNDTILIIGNGLSTRYLAHLGFDKIPKNVDTFGMGAAYRYYSYIGWWPTYYALCDIKVVFYHQKNLKAIIEDPDIPVRKYFLPLRVSDNEKLEIIPHSSTGDFCVRKAIELGYKRIFIIGIETDYIEQIRESRQLTPEEIEQIGLGQ
ncbi:MAG: glycosyltransferase, partial [Deltaproteobacteria bacterium]|nr:glycosyltransferase [Deltaproteobacteria bacterium]